MRPVLFLLLFSLALACKHRRGPTVSEEWDSAGDKQRLNLADLISDARGVRFLELYDDGFLLTDSLTYRFDGQQPSLLVERRYDAVPMSGEEPLVASQKVTWSLDAQKVFLNSLKTTNVRHVPTCNPYSAVDGGYGGRFFTIQDPSGHEHTFGASDAICASSDHDCSGPCISAAAMDAIQKTLTAIVPIPEKPQTTFRCAANSPEPCGSADRTETVIFGVWQRQEPRGDVRRMLASRLCDMAAFTSEKNSDGSWTVFSSTHERLGVVRIDSQALTVSCVSR